MELGELGEPRRGEVSKRRRASWFGRRCLALLVVLGAVLCQSAGAATGVFAATGITDLGAGVRPVRGAAPAVVDGSIDVPVPGGIWREGAVITPTAPASNPSAVFETAAVNSSGVVVGEILRYLGTPGAFAASPAYWDSEHSSSFVVLSLSGLSVNGKPATSGGFSGVDSAGEAVGSISNDGINASAADSAGVYAAASGGLPKGGLSAVSSAGGTPIRALGAISAGYELGESGSNFEAFSIDRSNGAASPTGLAVNEANGLAMADNGAIVGSQSSGSGGQSAVVRPGGGTTVLSSAGTGHASLGFDVNASGIAVGAIDGSPHTAVQWDATGASTELETQLAPGSGWTLTDADGISDSGVIDGYGMLNGQSHGFLLGEAPPPNPPIVNSTGDAPVAAGAANGCDTGQKVTINGEQKPECTLRAAIEAENAGSVSEEEITFALPGSAGSTITPAGALPPLTATGVTIKGGGITLAGQASAGVAGLTLSGGSEVVRGLRLANWQVAVLINSPSGADTVTATTIVGPGHASGVRGVDIENSPNDVIGGTTGAAGNGITAVTTGVYVNGPAATGTTIEGNLIGTTSSGSSNQTETIDGVFAIDASGTTIGGTSSAPGTAPGNVIDADAGGLAGSGTGSAVTIGGVSATVTGATVAGNLIGLAPDGHTRAGLSSDGVLVAGSVQGAVIGGAAAGAGNVIAGAEEADVDIDGTSVSGTKVLGNLIGTDATGMASVDGSEKGGVMVLGASHTQIGSPGVGRNVITAAQVAGILTTTATKKVTVVATGEVLPGTTTTQESSMGTTIGGNVIGPLADGKTLPAQIQSTGVALRGIGETLGPGDEISGNRVGVEAAGSHEQIVGEEIGTDSSGAVALPNVVGAVVPKGNTGTPAIGVPGARPNTISGNSATAVLLGAPASVQNNLIGTNTVGTAALAPYPGALPDPLQGNLQEAAVILSPGITGTTAIGGSASGAGNVISGNPNGAIILNSPAKAQGNRIGVAAGSDAALPNKGKGIYASVPATLGADPANPGAGANVVANETEGGILVGPNAEPTTMVSDSIYANASFGVAIAASGAPAPPVLTAHQNPDGSGTRVDIFATEDEPAGTLLQVYATTDCAAGAVQPHTLLATVSLEGPLAHGDTATVVLDPQAAGTQLTATTTTGGLEPKTSKSVACTVVPAVNSLGGALPAQPAAGAGGGTGPVPSAGALGGGGGTVKTAGPKVVLPITASCSPAGSHSCTVVTTAKVSGSKKKFARVELVRAGPPARASSSVVGHGRQTLQPGAKAKLVLRLTGAGEKMLRARGRLSLAVTVTIEQAGDSKVTRTVPVTLRYRG